jgi:hypothetical protein
MNKTLFTACSFTLLSLVITACGSSSSDEESAYPSSYIQFYNGSANSSTTSLYVDDSLLGSSSYGDATSLGTLDADDVELEFRRIDADNKTVVVKTLSTNLKAGTKTLFVLSGDYAAADIVELSFNRETLEDHFRLFTTSVVTSVPQYDVYMGEDGAPFSDATLVSKANYQTLDEAVYWAPDASTVTDASDDFDLDAYVIYLTLPGESEPIYESPTISFIYSTEYVIAVRNTAGALRNNLILDVIVNSTAVASYADVNASSQYRIYNSLDEDSALTVSLTGNKDQDDVVTLAPNSLSEFKQLAYGDYRLSASIESGQVSPLANRLLTLNQGESKAVVLYADSTHKLKSLAFIESALPQTYDHEIKVANLVQDFTDLEIYFVRNDETIQTAKYKLSSLDFEESRSIVLPRDYYEIVAVYDDGSGNELLLERTVTIGFNEEVNYIVTIEKSAAAPSGYSVAILH